MLTDNDNNKNTDINGLNDDVWDITDNRDAVPSDEENKQLNVDNITVDSKKDICHNPNLILSDILIDNDSNVENEDILDTDKINTNDDWDSLLTIYESNANDKKQQQINEQYKKVQEEKELEIKLLN